MLLFKGSVSIFWMGALCAFKLLVMEDSVHFVGSSGNWCKDPLEVEANKDPVSFETQRDSTQSGNSIFPEASIEGRAVEKIIIKMEK